MTKRTSANAMPAVFTIGHSTRPIEAFVHLLQANQVGVVVDIRTIPRSRHNPQFNRETLPASLQAAGIDYVHLAGLGGLRHPRPDSRNMAWTNASFRGFADYMQTPEFEENLDKLLELAGKKQVVLMCAEAVPWRCHRSLIADALLARHVSVEHILGSADRRSHTRTPWARVRGTHVTYPARGTAATTEKRRQGSAAPATPSKAAAKRKAKSERSSRSAGQQRLWR